MPWHVVGKGNEWLVIGADGKVHGRHKTKKEAREQQKAIYANAGKGHK